MLHCISSFIQGHRQRQLHYIPINGIRLWHLECNTHHRFEQVHFQLIPRIDVAKTLRFLQLSFRIVPLIILYPLFRFSPLYRIPLKDISTISSIPKSLSFTLGEWWLKCLVSSLVKSGPTLIKLGQWASSRPDVFPPTLCNSLSALQSHSHLETSTNSFYFEQSVRPILESELGAPLSTVFSTIDSTSPIGSGAVALVYKAKLASNGSDVAVKVIRPHVANLVSLDIAILTYFASWIPTIAPYLTHLDIPTEMKHFSSQMENQLDLRIEARNLQTFAKNFSHTPNVQFPTPVIERCTSRVLVETFHGGIPLQTYLSTPSKHDAAVAQIGLSSFLKMLLHDNFYHMDLHPGNVLVDLPPSTSTAQWWFTHSPSPTLTVLDCGIASSLSPRNQETFKRVISAALQFDGAEIAHLFTTRSDSPSTVRDPEGLKDTLTTLFTGTNNLFMFFKFYLHPFISVP